ncbi:MAG: ADP-ribosylglycohydrolase family protein [Desulfotomaculaceae bacterium]|nr:ADP-ribosylglycohydrolase family protein [Desulfotomaculaceae bacterium]
MGGAIGDALGWPIEFIKYRDIIRRYGPDGIQDLQR